MSERLDLIPVEKDELFLEQPLPYDLYDRNGLALMKEGDILTLHKSRDLLKDSWRSRGSQDPPRPEPLLGPSTETPRIWQPKPMSAVPCIRRPLTEAKVLIAEDMKLSQKLLVNMLNHERIYKIETADDGNSAVNKFRARHFDLVFLDIDMPVMDGLSALAEMKAHKPCIFITLVSASATSENVLKGKEFGVNAFLVKPISGLSIERILKMYRKDCPP